VAGRVGGGGGGGGDGGWRGDGEVTQRHRLERRHGHDRLAGARGGVVEGRGSPGCRSRPGTRPGAAGAPAEDERHARVRHDPGGARLPPPRGLQEEPGGVRRPEMELNEQVAIVTGAGRGIGRATALELARMGADIVVAEVDKANAERTASEVRTLGRRASVVPTDVTSHKDLAAMAERTRAEFGRIDILVNNAGIYRAAATLDVTEEH